MTSDAIKTLRGFRQTRQYEDRPVPDDVLNDILEVGRWSGSSKNSQPWGFLVLTEKDGLRKLAEAIPYGKFLADAPLGIALVMDGQGTGQSLDAGRVAERMMLAAHARGVGAGLATISDATLQAETARMLGAPEGTSVGVGLAFGYAAPKDPKAPPRPNAGRRPLEDVVHYNRFGQRARQGDSRMAVTDRVGSRVMFENDRARIWEQLLEPGAWLESHAHHLPYFYVVIDGAEIRLGDGTWRSRPNEIGFYEIAPGDERVDPRLENIGTTTHRSFVVELKPDPAGGYDHAPVATGAKHDGKTPPSENVGTRLMFANERVRIWDLSLAPGDRLGKHIHRVDNFFIMISGGLIRFENPDDPTDFRDVQFEDGKVTWVNVLPEGKIDNRLENIGTRSHRNLLIELLR